MSHRKLTANPVPEATNVDSIETFDVFNCDNCGDPISKDRVILVSGTLILPNGAAWPLSGHLDEDCIIILSGLIPREFKNAPAT